MPVAHSTNPWLLVLLDRLVAARREPVLVPDLGREIEEVAGIGGKNIGLYDPSDLVELLTAVRALVANGLVVRTDRGYLPTETGQQVAASTEQSDRDLADAIRKAATALTNR